VILSKDLKEERKQAMQKPEGRAYAWTCSVNNSESSMAEAEEVRVMFIAALFTIAKLWKQPRCPTTDE
jgi:hypothetical protein